MRGARAGRARGRSTSDRGPTAPKLAFLPAHHSAPGTRPAYSAGWKGGKKKAQSASSGGDPAQKGGTPGATPPQRPACPTAASSLGPRGPGPPPNRLPFCPHANTNPTPGRPQNGGRGQMRREQSTNKTPHGQGGKTTGRRTRQGSGAQAFKCVSALSAGAARHCVRLRGDVTALGPEQKRRLCFRAHGGGLYTEPPGGAPVPRCKSPGPWGRVRGEAGGGGPTCSPATLGLTRRA